MRKGLTKKSMAAVAKEKSAAPQAALLRRRRRRRQLDDYEPRSTMILRRWARRRGDADLLEALDDPDFARAANATVIALAEEEGVDVDSDRPFLDWFMSILEALKPAII